MGARTTFEGGGLLMTSTAPTSLGGEVGERYRRVEIGADSADELIREHERHVADFGRDVGLRVKAATLAEVEAKSLVLSKPFVARNRFAGLYAIAMIYLMPFWGLVRSAGRPHRLPWLIPASLCGAAVLFAIFRLMVLPEYRRIRWVAFVGLAAFGFGLPMWLGRVRPRHRADHRAAAPAAEVTPAAATAHR